MKMKKNILGVDICGTKCAVIYGQKEGDTLHLVEKVKFPTTSVDETIANICSEIEQMMEMCIRDSPFSAGLTDREPAPVC